MIAESAFTADSPAIESRLLSVEQLTGALRKFLDDNGIGEWPIFFAPGGELYGLDTHLAALTGDNETWRPLAPWCPAGEQPAGLSIDEKKSQLHEAGVLWLRDHGVVAARWHYFNFEHSAWAGFHLYAAASQAHFRKLRERLHELQRGQSEGNWTIISGEPWRDQLIERGEACGWDDLIIAPQLRHRLETEVIPFFNEDVARLYREIGMSHRRGVLLHGPPGNGKTSLIRLISTLNRAIPVLVLRPGAQFDSDDFERVIQLWQERAPAILAIEDLDTLFPRIPVSMFLNLIDGIEQRTGGLLMIATTNHPESLDPAINNRPGRFDVVIEIQSPDRALRQCFFQRTRLAPLGDAALQKLSSMTDGLSFAHLKEIEHLSGLLALRAQRSARSEEDALHAARIVAGANADARHGFPEPAQPFGFARTT